VKWPAKSFAWIQDRVCYVSIPFTWELPRIKSKLMQQSFDYDRVIVGGPAVKLMPDFFNGLDWIKTADHYPGVLQKINRFATRTTAGCINRCPFCAVPKIEPDFKQLDDWPDLPVICDNNLLAASLAHFDRVIDRLIGHGWANFNGGLEAKRLTEYHARRIAEIKKPVVYMALDNTDRRDHWQAAFDLLRAAGLGLKSIRAYALIGYNTDPAEAWYRCEYLEAHGVKAIPQWYHPLNALEKNAVTEEQRRLGWDDLERRRIMQWYYKHKRINK
jgi:hypothetical protein